MRARYTYSMTMTQRDADGMPRADYTWTIEGRRTKTGTAYGVHTSELEELKNRVKSQAKRGDTWSVTEIKR